jgi:hypothetical protein
MPRQLRPGHMQSDRFASCTTQLTRLFDCLAKRSKFSLDRRLWGGVLVRDAAGQAGSFEGTPPRHFLRRTGHTALAVASRASRSPHSGKKCLTASWLVAISKD